MFQIGKELRPVALNVDESDEEVFVDALLQSAVVDKGNVEQNCRRNDTDDGEPFLKMRR